MVGLIASLVIAIPAGDLTQTLNEWSRQTDTQVLFDYLEFNGVDTEEVYGQMTAEQALQRLLSDTGLKYDYVNGRTVAVTGHPRKKTCKPWMGSVAPLPPCTQKINT